MKPAAEQLATLRRGAVEIIGEDDLAERLARGKRLRIKAGFDPTAPDLHLGHAVLLTKMRQFQQFGHQVIFLIGDFTALIGDPSGRNEARPLASAEQIAGNSLSYADQVYKILNPDLTEVRRNSEWMGRMSAAELVSLAQSYTVARLLERDDFASRFEGRKPISVHELLYPLVQGHDSCMLECDVELGGTDQKFNLLVGRDLQRQRGQPPQAVLTTPLLEGLDGSRKMSKSYGNFIGLSEPAQEIYGKTMSISDDLMWRYFQLLSLRPEEELAGIRKRVADGGNPRDAKRELAHELTQRLHDRQAADAAAEQFEARFQRHEIPEQMPEQVVHCQQGSNLPVAVALRAAGLAGSSSAARRLIEQGGVRIDGKRIEDPDHRLAAGSAPVAQVGKRRFCRLLVEKKGD